MHQLLVEIWRYEIDYFKGAGIKKSVGPERKNDIYNGWL